MPKDSQGNEIKYSGFPIISNIDKYVQEELANRSFDRVRAITPFIKVTPGFSPDGSVASKIVLKGIEATAYGRQGEYQFKDLYRPDAFYRPLAGVTKLTVDYKNEYGSIRQATIEWICHTLDDLERLSPFFLNPGYSMFVEWGWSNHAKEVINDDPQVDLGNYFEYGKDKQKLTNGNYDCLMGVVTNYSFAINRDGGFNCTTVVMSSGYLMEGLTVPNQFTIDFYQSKKKKLETKYKNEGKSDEEAKKLAENDMTGEVHVLDEIYRTLQNFLQEEFFSQIKKDYQKYNSVDESTDYFILQREENGMDYLVDDASGVEVKEVKYEETEGFDSSGNKISKTKVSNVPTKASVYATWGYLEDEVLNKHIKIKNKKTDNDGGKMLFSFNSENSKISCHKFLRTTDLGVCIVPISKGDKVIPPVPDFKRGETVENGVDFGYVRRLLINVQFFRDTMLSATTVNDGVLQVFSKINDSCINYWNFRMFAIEQEYDDGDKTGGTPLGFAVTPAPFTENIKKNKAIVQQRIVDLNYSDKLFEQIGLDGDLYSFRTKAFDITVDGIKKKATSVVRNMSFQSKLSNEAALNVFYSAQNEDGKVMGTPSNNTFQSLYEYDKYNTTITNPTDTFSLGPLKVENPKLGEEPTDVKLPDPGTETESMLKEQYGYGHELLHFLPYKEYGYYVKIEDKQLSGIEGMKIAVLYANKGDAPLATSAALVLLELEMELEGISGIRIGNVFTIDHIPKIYQNRGVFQVIGITDNVDKNSWVTKIKSGFRVYQNVKYEEATRTSQVVTKTDITSIVDTKLIDKDKDPAPKININRVGASTATNTRVYAARALDLKTYTKDAVQALIDKGTLVEIGNANTNSRFAMSNSSIIFDGRFYLEKKAAEQFKKWYDEMVASGVNFIVSSAMRFGANTGAGPHGYGIAVDFGSLYSIVYGNTNPQANLAARINTPEYSKIAEIGKKYGWYNPWRLSNQSGQEELWHFEYWGEA